MRVLQVVHALPPATYGGTELYTCDLAGELAAQGHEVAVAAPRGADDSGSGSDDSALESDSGLADVEAFELPDPEGETAPEIGGRPLDAVVRPSVDDRFRSVLAEWSPDVVHLQHFKHLSATLPSICETLGIACVATLHDFWTICHREQLYRPEGRPCSGPESVEKCTECYRLAGVEDGRTADGAGRTTHVADGVADEAERPAEAGERVTNDRTTANDRTTDGSLTTGDESTRTSVERRENALGDALSATDRLVAPSAFLRETFVEYGRAPEDIVQRENGIRVDRFEDAGFDPDGPLRVGYAGRITERKGVHLLVDAASEVGGVDLHVFGRFDPTSEDYHARLADMAAGEATFHGRYADRATPYREMDVLVLPSVWYENNPLVILEAFASGLPVVTADVGGMAELVDDGENGLTFQVGDSAALADTLARLAADPDLVADLRDGVTEPKRLVDHAREIADLYAECVAQGE